MPVFGPGEIQFRADEENFFYGDTVIGLSVCLCPTDRANRTDSFR